MDDGHQNFTLAKDLSLVVVESGAFGFRQWVDDPGGASLREPVTSSWGLARADAVIVVMAVRWSKAMRTGARPSAPRAIPILALFPVRYCAPIWNRKKIDLSRQACLRFRRDRAAGEIRGNIAPPWRHEVTGTQFFADHHPLYTRADIAGAEPLESNGTTLITTDKDFGPPDTGNGGRNHGAESACGVRQSVFACPLCLTGCWPGFSCHPNGRSFSFPPQAALRRGSCGLLRPDGLLHPVRCGHGVQHRRLDRAQDFLASLAQQNRLE